MQIASRDKTIKHLEKENESVSQNNKELNDENGKLQARMQVGGFNLHLYGVFGTFLHLPGRLTCNCLMVELCFTLCMHKHKS